MHMYGICYIEFVQLGSFHILLAKEYYNFICETICKAVEKSF
jgi:hypothetical protein